MKPFPINTTVLPGTSGTPVANQRELRVAEPNTRAAKVNRYAYLTGGSRHFDCIVASCTVSLAKPDKDRYECVLDPVHTRAETSRFIDGKQENLDPVKDLGFMVVLAKGPGQIVRDLECLLTAHPTPLQD